MPQMVSRAPNILVTGAAGSIGKTIRPVILPLAGILRSADIAPVESVGPADECVMCDLRDMAAVRRAMEGIDIVFHLGGHAWEMDWPSIRDTNIEGTYHVFEAARQAGTRRIVFASSNHVTGFHPRGERIGPDAEFRPDSRYGVAKIFGEALGRLYADKHGLEVICLRIGQFRPVPSNIRMLSLWLSPGDMARLAERCVLASDVGFEVVYGISANTRNWYDNPGASRIGFVAADNAENHRDGIPPEGHVESEVEAAFQGGPFCSAEYDSKRPLVS
jgi:uronate dehydrogenase